ncbi:nucleotidyltransferase family protein [Clostridium tarantellae]|uniref:Nucleotidyltransferase domain-containing protein n=1 Tax=Clostridium tarantellae TaxID=39493 RepID=A0A6I1MSI3_9CLOT|nr:nucleotidyltransferase domain-containing protein [Clostridium tarantellae]MPQ43209.1 nucleotidyltransferase domain-containing protein [Clostridium tarantellae]
MFGLLERDIHYINKALSKFNEIEKVILFGSRAIGNYKSGSDIDIALIGTKVTEKTLIKLEDYLNEIYPIPYFFDILIYKNIQNKNLKNHIDEKGKVLYEKVII